MSNDLLVKLAVTGWLVIIFTAIFGLFTVGQWWNARLFTTWKFFTISYVACWLVYLLYATWK